MDLKDLSFITSRQHLPHDSDELKELILFILKAMSEQQAALLETIDYLKSEIVLLKRFRYGQRSERKKKV